MNRQALFLLMCSYFIGAIPTGYWLGLFWKGVDVRQHGSGNLGATNVFRVLGKGPGALTLILDILKGLLPVLWCQAHFKSDVRLATWTALATVIGHTMSVFVRFRGGKGVATAAGAFAALSPIPLLIAAGIFAVSLFTTGFVSLSSILAVLGLAVASFYWAPNHWQLGLAVGVALFIIWKHRSNIQRLCHGTEPRIWRKAA